MPTYKQLIADAKKYNIPYAIRQADGKVVWKPKATLERDIEAARAEKSSTTTTEVLSVKTEKEEKEASDPFTRFIQQTVDKAMTAYTPSTPVIKEIVIKSPVKETKVEGLTHEAFDRVLRLASQRINVLMVGPAGCGKTLLASQIAKALDLPFNCLSCSSGTSESQLLGWLLPLGSGGQFTYHPAPFVTAYETGGIFLLDELDSADANLMTVINSALANSHLSIPHRPDKSLVSKHQDFICLAAANTFGHGANRQYVGRNQLDAATLDRFRAGLVVMDYDKNIEQQTIPDVLLEWGLGIRAKIAEHGFRRILSTRFLQQAAQMMAAYPKEETLRAIKDNYFSDWTKEEKEKVN